MDFNDYLSQNKIPEWYNMYFDYETLDKKIKACLSSKDDGKFAKLKGYYINMPNSGVKILKIDPRESEHTEGSHSNPEYLINTGGQDEE
jgi:hypothetical protein